jgi:hypothetical protein
MRCDCLLLKNKDITVKALFVKYVVEISPIYSRQCNGRNKKNVELIVEFLLPIKLLNLDDVLKTIWTVILVLFQPYFNYSKIRQIEKLIVKIIATNVFSTFRSRVAAVALRVVLMIFIVFQGHFYKS